MSVIDRCYQLDKARGILFILPRKCATHSITTAAELELKENGASSIKTRDEALVLNADHFTITCLRHPLDRAVAGVYQIPHYLQWDFAGRLRYYSDDPHVAPQYLALEGLRIDHYLWFETLQEQWRELQRQFGFKEIPHENKFANFHNPEHASRPLNWRDACDWSEFLPMYEKDFSLNPLWERP